MSHRKREDWFTAAIPILKKKGLDGITIDVLCVSLERTKGSFYHHFKNQDAFLKEFIDWWYTTSTAELIEEINQAGTAAQKMQLIESYGYALDLELENAMRAWARTDARAADVINRMDETRLRFLVSIYKSFITDEQLAVSMANIDYAMSIGFIVMDPNELKNNRKTMQDYIKVLSLSFLSLAKVKSALHPDVNQVEWEQLFLR